MSEANTGHLIADDDDDDDDDATHAAAVPHTPRFEPSWHFDAVPAEQVEHCLRARRRGGLDRPAVAWLHKYLVTLGHEANARSAHFLAHSWFECAFQVKDSPVDLLGSINMRLRLGQATLAKALYERVLERVTLTDAQRELATRKLAEATAAGAARTEALETGDHRHARAFLRDELEQLLERFPTSLPDEELEKVLPLLRLQGHRANHEGDYEAAQHWFDCMHSLSRQPADLLSAANMRLKLEAGSPLAEALYRHALALPELPEEQAALAERKLQQVTHQQAVAMTPRGLLPRHAG